MGRPSFLPLAAAAARLRGKPGRPRKAESGHIPGTATAATRMNAGPERGVLASYTMAPLVPRLLDLPTAAAYLGVSVWTIRDLEAAGILPRVRIPLPNGNELRKLLFDKADLDQVIGAWKERGTGP